MNVDVNCKAERFNNQPDFLWKVIQRYDSYINATNTKAGMIAAFNTFVFGTIVIKWKDLLPLYGNHLNAALLAGALLAIAALAALVSLWYAFSVINPFLKSPKKPTQYHSAIFFSHVAEHAQPEQYLSCMDEISHHAIYEDLAFQTHALACGLDVKFKKLRISVGAVIFALVPALSLMVAVKLFTLMADILSKGITQ